MWSYEILLRIQWCSYGSDRYTEIKMCDLELFSKIWSHIMCCMCTYTMYVRTIILCTYISYYIVHIAYIQLLIFISIWLCVESTYDDTANLKRLI